MDSIDAERQVLTLCVAISFQEQRRSEQEICVNLAEAKLDFENDSAGAFCQFIKHVSCLTGFVGLIEGWARRSPTGAVLPATIPEQDKVMWLRAFFADMQRSLIPSVSILNFTYSYVHFQVSRAGYESRDQLNVADFHLGLAAITRFLKLQESDFCRVVQIPAEFKESLAKTKRSLSTLWQTLLHDITLQRQQPIRQKLMAAFKELVSQNRVLQVTALEAFTSLLMQTCNVNPKTTSVGGLRVLPPDQEYKGLLHAADVAVGVAEELKRQLLLHRNATRQRQENPLPLMGISGMQQMIDCLTRYSQEASIWQQPLCSKICGLVATLTVALDRLQD